MLCPEYKDVWKYRIKLRDGTIFKGLVNGEDYVISTHETVPIFWRLIPEASNIRKFDVIEFSLKRIPLDNRTKKKK